MSQMSDERIIAFRKLCLEDMPLLHVWLNAPHVHAWYDKDECTSLEEVTRRYRPLTTGEDATDAAVILLAGTPVGYIQTYRIHDNPDYARHIGFDEHAAGVDLFIGESAQVGKGLGTRLLRQFLRSHVFSQPGITQCVIGPEPMNKRAIRAYEKVGFRHVRTVVIPGEPDPEYLMHLTAAELR